MLMTCPKTKVSYRIPDNEEGSVPPTPPLDGAVLSCFCAHDLFTVQAYHADVQLQRLTAAADGIGCSASVMRIHRSADGMQTYRCELL